MSATDDVARMLTLVPWLLERPGASIEEIVTTFGTDERTIRADLESLDFCGLPGLGGGDLFEVDIVEDRVVVRMADELRRPLRLTPREALRLVLTVDAVAEAMGEELPALRSAVDKVRSAAGVPDGVRVQLEAEGGRWVAPIREAIAAGRRLRLSYQGRSDDSPQDRLLDPWALHVAEGNWYVQGYDHGAEDRRTFRLDRIAELTVLTEPVTHTAPAGPLPPPRYAPSPDDTAVELVLGPGARWLADVIDADEVEDLAGGRRRVRFSTDALRWVERLVLMGAGEVEVVAPGGLGEDVRAEARTALARYA
ncbi:MAG: WYL domain-containing protein [Actinobacteria bacterium]|nr:WYL domain-containing protein [Actinomycetota bacterium]